MPENVHHMEIFFSVLLCYTYEDHVQILFCCILFQAHGEVQQTPPDGKKNKAIMTGLPQGSLYSTASDCCLHAIALITENSMPEPMTIFEDILLPTHKRDQEALPQIPGRW